MGQVTECKLLDNTRRYFKIAHIDVDTPYISGRVCAVCVDNPVSELIIGNVEGAKKPDQVEAKVTENSLTPGSSSRRSNAKSGQSYEEDYNTPECT
ncbi:hypothetical protein HOLleu_01888 [Holothuria leucospilota]|uniref:Uncharacterized protein n=1 Tax=Holothuria leucospilota TaxID=206669 RepID=A0A9Q1CRL6_HOLLE|nr:hypothetical protein HOLleu_01888 [Holothuria leucospilota]